MSTNSFPGQGSGWVRFCVPGGSVFACRFDSEPELVAEEPHHLALAGRAHHFFRSADGGVELALVAQTMSPNGATLQGMGFSTMGAPTAILIRSNSLDPTGPVVFGDGLRCVNTSPPVRLTAAANAAGGVSTHIFGHDSGPGIYYCQLWYRNTPSSYCTTAAFNLSSGRTLVW